MIVASPSEPSDSVKARVNTFLRKMPQGEEDWNARVASSAALQEYHRVLLLPDASPTVSLEELFYMYSQRILRLVEHAEETVVDYLKVLALGTGRVLLAESRADQIKDDTERRLVQKRVCDGVRLCFRSAGSNSTLDDQRLLEYMASISRGAEVMYCLEIFLSPRAYELPLQGE